MKLVQVENKIIKKIVRFINFYKIKKYNLILLVLYFGQLRL